MDIARICVRNVRIRDCRIKEVFGIYVKGEKTTLKSPYDLHKELWKEKRQEIINNHYTKPQRDLWPNPERDVAFRLVQVKPESELWHGQCPYSSRKDIPFMHGCEIYTYGGPLNPPCKEFIFFLIGQNHCNMLEQCAKNLGKKLGMGSKVTYLEGTKQLTAKIELEHVIENFKHLY